MKKLLLLFACAYTISICAMEQKAKSNPMPELLKGSKEFMECQSLLQNRNNELIFLTPALTAIERDQLFSLAKTQLSLDQMRVELSMSLLSTIRTTAAEESHKKSKRSHVRSSSSKPGPNVLEDLEKTGLIVASLKYGFSSPYAHLEQADTFVTDEYKRCIEYIKSRKHLTIPLDLLTCLTPCQRQQIKFLAENQIWLHEKSIAEAMYYEASKSINPEASAAEQEETLNTLNLLPNKRMWEHLNRSSIMLKQLTNDLKKIPDFPSSDSDSEESSTESMVD